MKLIEVVAEATSGPTVRAAAEKFKAHDFRVGLQDENGMQPMSLVVTDDKVQSVLDTLQNVLGAQPTSRLFVVPIEVALPRPPEEERKKEDEAKAVRESLYEAVEKNVRLDLNYIVLVVLSTVVAAIGLIEGSAAVVIGAMVIAPLLNPNLALGLGTALGDIKLMRRALWASAVGIGLALALSAAIGLIWPFTVMNPEILSRTDARWDSIALALASGAAAALSLTTGLSSVLVGVMVAVALLPPAAAAGLMLGRGQADLALGAALLLAVNIVCINLASKIVFLLKGIRPRTWWEKEKANRAMVSYILVWLLTLAFLAFVIYGRRTLPIG